MKSADDINHKSSSSILKSIETKMASAKVNLTFVLLAIIYATNVKASPHHRIVNGESAHIYQFPWHVSLHITLTDNNIRYCGGTLISRDIVMTAAWCLRDAQSIQIDMGSVLFLQPLQSQVSTTFVSHSQYNAEFNTNNIGLIRLPQAIAYYSNTLRAILLPGTNQSAEPYIDVPAYISGFGVTVEGSVYLSEELKFAHQTTLTNQQCQQSYSQGFVPESAICAIGVNNTAQTACYGDFGGALVVQYQDTWMQIGIASYVHPSGCFGMHPVIYTRITSYIEWIKQMTGISY